MSCLFMTTAPRTHSHEKYNYIDIEACRLYSLLGLSLVACVSEQNVRYMILLSILHYVHIEHSLYEIFPRLVLIAYYIPCSSTSQTT